MFADLGGRNSSRAAVAGIGPGGGSLRLLAQREALTEDSFDADQLLLKPGIAQPGLEQAFDARQAAVKGVDGELSTVIRSPP